MTTCGACLDTYWLMADETQGHCPLCMTVDRMKQAVWEGSQAQRDADAEAKALSDANAELEVKNAALSVENVRLEGNMYEPLETVKADALNYLRAYFVSLGWSADPVTIADPNLAELYEALT